MEWARRDSILAIVPIVFKRPYIEARIEAKDKIPIQE